MIPSVPSRYSCSRKNNDSSLVLIRAPSCRATIFKEEEIRSQIADSEKTTSPDIHDAHHVDHNRGRYRVTNA